MTTIISVLIVTLREHHWNLFQNDVIFQLMNETHWQPIWDWCVDANIVIVIVLGVNGFYRCWAFVWISVSTSWPALVSWPVYQWSDLQQTAVFSLRAAEGSLVFAAADVDHSGEAQTHKNIIRPSHHLRSFHHTLKSTSVSPHRMLRSWQPTAAYLHVGSTSMSLGVALRTTWWVRLNSVPLTV